MVGDQITVVGLIFPWRAADRLRAAAVIDSQVGEDQLMRRMWAAVAAILMCLALLVGSVGSAAQSPGSSVVAPRESIPSAGCGASTAAAGTTFDFMPVADLTRYWYLHVPPAHDGRTPTPLVIQLHGYGWDSARQAAYTKLDALGDELGFVTVSPDGRGDIKRWFFELDERGWDVTPSNPDAVFIGALIDRLGETLCLDLARVFVTGMSNGGMASTALACTLGERIAAIAPVAGFFDFGDACRGARPVPMLAFYGQADSIALYEGGMSAGLQEAPTDAGVPLGDIPMAADPVWPVPVPQRAAGIAERYGCAPEATPVPITSQVQRTAYPCPEGAAVVLVVARDGGHTWPGAVLSADDASQLGPTNMEIDASRMMWDFFVQHPLPVD
jgi:polyhydroxybutyrate depolymerase